MAYLTPGARALRLTAAKPAALTAVACINPMMHLIPIGIESISGFPMSKIKNENQSVQLERARSDQFEDGEPK
jgi:hypothetical protein